MSIEQLQRAIRNAAFDCDVTRIKIQKLAADAVTAGAFPYSVEKDFCELTVKMKPYAELITCLSRLVDGRTPNEILNAFGSPGNFGYETPIGNSLSRIYYGY